MKDEQGDEPAPKAPVFYPPDAVLTLAQVAAGLQIGERSAERLKLPVAALGTQTRRYVWRLVVLYLEGLSR